MEKKQLTFLNYRKDLMYWTLMTEQHNTIKQLLFSINLKITVRLDLSGFETWQVFSFKQIIVFDSAEKVTTMSIQIKKLEIQDLDKFIELIRVFEDVFEMKNFSLPDTTHLKNLFEKNSFFVYW